MAEAPSDDLTTPTSMELVVPGTGEVISLGSPDQCAQGLQSIKALQAQLREVRGVLEDVIREECVKRGVKTLHLEGGVTAVLSGGSERVYEAIAIEAELRDAGMPEDRIREIVEETVTYRVKANEAKRAASMNESYREIIERNSRVVEKSWTISTR